MDGVTARKQKCRNTLEKNDNIQYRVYQLGQAYKSEDLYISYTDFEGGDEANVQENKFDNTGYTQIQKNNKEMSSEINYFEQSKIYEESQDDEIDDKIEKHSESKFSLRDLPIFSQESILIAKNISSKFAFIVVMFVLVFSSFVFAGTAFAVKNKVDKAGKDAFTSIKIAIQNLRENNYKVSGEEFDKAYKEFNSASIEMNKVGNFATFVAQFIPGMSKLSSGNHIIQAGKYLTHAAKTFNQIIPVVIDKDSTLVTPDSKHVSFLAIYELVVDQLGVAYEDVTQAREHIDKVYLNDVPKEYQDTFVKMRELLPLVEKSLKHGIESRSAVEELLGANGSRTYLFLFQNNNEMRATGGFIGSYGLIKINNGNIEKMIVDDIFNPDGQLTDRIVPPLPIQKISADWSLHDSNWFIDFPLSAKKAIDFYERTGGPTVDGVIAITPAVMEKFLTITGPIALPKQGVVLTDKNFIEVLQNKIEDKNNYLEKENVSKNAIKKEEINNTKNDINNINRNTVEVTKKQPKKILADLMPIMLDKLSDRKSPEYLAKLLSVVSNGLRERHIIMYMTNKNVQDIIESNNWGGIVLQTDKDYLSVINTNINGFKTDGVIDETITHTADIDKDGHIIDTVQIKRVHKGGKTGFPWWDAVNSDYMRVYVPQGSKLLSVEGQTREINTQRLDYDALGYQRDCDVEKEENNTYIDEETGTRIYNEYNKTVFANWVYVSPQENVTITYKYELPFRIDFNYDQNGKFGSYAVLFQKQSGSEHSSVISDILLPKGFLQIWNSQDTDTLKMQNNLTIDRYHGTVFRVKNK